MTAFFGHAFLSLIIILVPLGSGCDKGDKPENDEPKASKASKAKNQSYGYIFEESTGLNQWAEKDGRRIPIKFHESSNQKELDALRALRWQVLYPNSKGQIRLTGRISPETRCADWSGKEIPTPKSGDTSTCAGTFHPFTLTHWTLETPFRMIQMDAADPLGDGTVVEKKTLTADCFKTAIENVERYQLAIDAPFRKLYLDTTRVDGNLSLEAVERVIRKNLPEAVECYHRALASNPELSGKLIMEWTISPDGTVESVTNLQNTMMGRTVADCIASRIKKWKFPEPESGKVRVMWPYECNPQKNPENGNVGE